MKEKTKNKSSTIAFILLTIIPLILLAALIKYFYSDTPSPAAEKTPSKVAENGNDTKEKSTEESKSSIPKTPVKKEVLVSTVGDVLIGNGYNFNYSTSLGAAFENSGRSYTHFFKNVLDIFTKDDLTIANLETPLTDAKVKSDKGTGTVFHFKGEKDYVNILTNSSIEGVTIANNHIYDYGDQGYKDTVATLSSANLGFFGEGSKLIKEVQGIKFGFLGYQGWSDSNDLKEKIKNDIKALRDEGCSVVIPYFHWGIERQYTPYSVQVNLAHYSIDNGADMVWGSHPHVVQTMEVYAGKLIAYSMGNFCFGGNSNPSDKRTYILQSKFNFSDDKLENVDFKIIPTRISSVSYKNDYVPTPYNGNEKNAFLKFINSISPTLKGKISDSFQPLKSAS